ncbi:MAG: hypothetical protein ACPG07_07045, partial [Henriciella sp.]
RRGMLSNLLEGSAEEWPAPFASRRHQAMPGAWAAPLIAARHRRPWLATSRSKQKLLYQRHFVAL